MLGYYFCSMLVHVICFYSAYEHMSMLFIPFSQCVWLDLPLWLLVAFYMISKWIVKYKWTVYFLKNVARFILHNFKVWEDIWTLLTKPLFGFITMCESSRSHDFQSHWSAAHSGCDSRVRRDQSKFARLIWLQNVLPQARPCNTSGLDRGNNVGSIVW